MPQNANTQITMTNAQKWALEAKSKQGWKCYFIERDAIYELQRHRNLFRQQVQNIRGVIEVQPDYEHLKQMFLDLYDKVGELCDCPVCMEEMTKEQTAVPICGHLVCKTCKEKMNECPLCRKKY